MTATKAPTEPPSTQRAVRRPGDRIFAGGARGSGIFILLVLAGVAAFLISEALPALTAPSEVIMPMAGFTASKGELHIVGVLAAGTIGTLTASARR